MTGLFLVVVFVALALVLNSAIYTENLASRDTGTEQSAALLERWAVNDHLAVAIDRTNGDIETTDYDELMSAFETDLASYNETIARQQAAEGRDVSIWMTDNTNGVRLRQTNESRDFTDANGNWNWTLATNVPGSSQHTMSIQGGSLYEATLDTTLAALADSAFGVEFHLDDYDGSGDGVWRVYFFQGAATDNIYAVVEQPNQTFQGRQDEAISGWLDQACATQGETITVRFSQSTFDGVHCDELSFYDDLGTHDLNHTNARSETVDDGAIVGDDARARGTYDIILGSTTHNSAAFDSVGTGQPFHQSAIYSVEYSVVYRTSGTDVTTANRRVIPSETDAGGLLREHPSVDTFGVTDVSDTLGAPGFDIDWSVSDTDRDLVRVELVMVSVADEAVVDTATVSVNGTTADGTTRLEDDSLVGGLGDDYLLQITAIDADGRATTYSETHTADS